MNSQVLIEAEARAPLTGTVDRYVELLCQQGCARVSEYISALQTGHSVPGVDELDPVERHALLEELISIMAIYQCSCDDG
jgi:hypothetical protein